ncbi:MAG: PqqD family peptide modification chaperone [Bacteroidales bacterium]|nr:PqqD family peptide modification chaperone [Bacteroidales bacterium]
MKTISIDSLVQRKDNDLIVSELDDDLVMMDIESGSYLSLNKTGRIIWEQLEQPVLVGNLIQHLMNRFSVDEKICTIETLDFLNKIERQKALLIY